MTGEHSRGYYIYRHQGKETAFEKALIGAGYWNAQTTSARIMLMDVDTAGRVGRLSGQFASKATTLFVYPHAARPFIGWDGLFTASQYTSASFVFTDGHIDVIRAYGYKKPLHTVGWAYSDILPFTPTCKPHNILFAPIHPNRNGWLSQVDKGINGRTYQILLDMIDAHGVELTVRHIKEISANGLWRDRRVKYVTGETDTNQTREIAQADVIVSHQTFAWISVAMGKPVVMMAEDIAPRNGGSDRDFKQVRSWGKYRDLLAYPLDILNDPDPYALLCGACESDDAIRDWKERMIGSLPFDSNRFISAMENYL